MGFGLLRGATGIFVSRGIGARGLVWVFVRERPFVINEGRAVAMTVLALKARRGSVGPNRYHFGMERVATGRAAHLTGDAPELRRLGRWGGHTVGL